MRTIRTLSLAGAVAGTLMGSLLVATALTPVRAADMTFERALSVDKEPQNWLLHHGNYQGTGSRRSRRSTPTRSRI